MAGGEVMNGWIIFGYFALLIVLTRVFHRAGYEKGKIEAVIEYARQLKGYALVPAGTPPNVTMVRAPASLACDDPNCRDNEDHGAGLHSHGPPPVVSQPIELRDYHPDLCRCEKCYPPLSPTPEFVRAQRGAYGVELGHL